MIKSPEQHTHAFKRKLYSKIPYIELVNNQGNAVPIKIKL
jgi:hypothetical protein